MFVAAGPNIKQNEKVFGLGLIDIAPTILHMYNLPVGKDMDGKVALDIFKQPTKKVSILSITRLEERKGIIPVLKSLGYLHKEKLIKPFIWKICGEGNQETEIKNYIDELKKIKKSTFEEKYPKCLHLKKYLDETYNNLLKPQNLNITVEEGFELRA